MSRRPSFQFYPGDWLSSLTISTFSAAEVGAYIQLLCYAWLSDDCGLPDDDKVLAQISKLGEDWAGASGRLVRSQFRAEDGRLYNARLLEEREKQDKYRANQSEAGRKGAQKRWGKQRPRNANRHSHANRAATDGVAMATPSFPNGDPTNSPMAKNSSSSSTSSSTSNQTPSSLDRPPRWDESEFLRLRDEYPNPIQIKDARKVWHDLVNQHILTESNVAEVFEGLDRWKHSRDWVVEDGKFIPSLAKWLSGRRWQDNPRPVSDGQADATRISTEGNDPNAMYQPAYRNPDGSLTQEAANLAEEPWPTEDLPEDLT